MYIEENYLLDKCTTFHLPVRCRYFATYESVEDLEHVLADSRLSGLPRLWLGGGSNMVFSCDFDGVVLKSAIKGIEKCEGAPEGYQRIRIGAGEEWPEVVEWAVAHDYYGIENLAGVPGTAGGAAVQNIGAYGVELSEVVAAVICYDVESRCLKRFFPEECGYAYRTSRFKSDNRHNLVVINLEIDLSLFPDFHLDYGPLKDLKPTSGDSLSASAIAARVVEIRNAKLPDPRFIGSAGSFFCNPVVDDATYRRLIHKYPEMPHYHLSDSSVKIPAAWLIDNAGLKGMRYGGAEVWHSQPLVLANTDHATSYDVMALMNIVRRRIYDIYGVMLHPEVVIVGQKGLSVDLCD